jgi:hypothetical protein
MSQESNIELEIEIKNDEKEFLVNIDFHLIEAAMTLQQDDGSVKKNEYEPVVFPIVQDVYNAINGRNPRFVTSNKEVVHKYLQDSLNNT